MGGNITASHFAWLCTWRILRSQIGFDVVDFAVALLRQLLVFDSSRLWPSRWAMTITVDHVDGVAVLCGS